MCWRCVVSLGQQVSACRTAIASGNDGIYDGVVISTDIITTNSNYDTIFN